MIWLEGNRVQVDPPKKPKKLTATRFASVLGLNPWATSFAAWCEITRTYQEPFDDNVYTRAGKAIEPKQIAYMRRAYAMTDIITPTDVYGPDYFKKTWGDFFRDRPIFGGMWDALAGPDAAHPEMVLEFKTTKRSEDWLTDVPEYYALQAALYAWLLEVDDVVMVVSFLEEKDYAAPEQFVPSAENTATREFKVSERYPNFEGLAAQAVNWWGDHVTRGVSPCFDEKKDAEILKTLRVNKVEPAGDTELAELLKEADEIQGRLEQIRESNGLDELETQLKEVTERIKGAAAAKFRPGDAAVELPGSCYVWRLTRSTRTSVDTEAIKKAGLFPQYSKTTETLRLECAKPEA